MEKLTLGLALFCDIFWLIAFLICLPSIKKKTTTGKYFFLWLFIAIYSTFEFTGGDFYHYFTAYQNNLSASSDRSHFEPFYYWLIHALPSDYFIWRFTVWGLAGFFWIQAIKNLKQNVRFAGLMFLLIVFFFFVGGRQALCFSVLYYALTIYYKKGVYKLKNAIIFLLLIMCSYFLHKTAIVYILIMFISMLPLGKRAFLLSLILFPVIYKIFDSLSYLFISEYSTFNEESATSMESYMEGETYTRNIFGQIHLFINRFPIFLLLIYSIWSIFIKKDIIPKIYIILLRMIYILIYISYLFVGRDISAYIAPRFWDASLFPLTLFAAGYMYNKRQTRFFKTCFYLLLFSLLYRFAYNIYKI